jgi:hypothetical protein
LKRAMSVAFLMLLLCSLLFFANVGTTIASEPGYEVEEAYTTEPVTPDGNWATGEWEDSWIEYMDASAADERFCYKADGNSGLYSPEFLIDSADITNDTGDIWQICIGIPDGGDFPLDGQNKIEIVGHETLTVYEGDGAGWVVVDSSPVTWADNMTIHDVPFDYEHWCVEVIIDKTTIADGAYNAAPPIGLRVAMYDESEDLWVAWPPQSDPNIPEGWGQITGGAASIPESFGIVAVLMLSSVAVAVSFFYLRKRPKSRSLSSRQVSRRL